MTETQFALAVHQDDTRPDVENGLVLEIISIESVLALEISGIKSGPALEPNDAKNDLVLGKGVLNKGRIHDLAVDTEEIDHDLGSRHAKNNIVLAGAMAQARRAAALQGQCPRDSASNGALKRSATILLTRWIGN